MWRKRSAYALLVGMHNGATPMEGRFISMYDKIHYKLKKKKKD